MRRALGAVAALASGVSLGGPASPSTPAVADDGGVPTLVVSRDSFVRRVTADGSLRAVTATPVAAPDSLSINLKIAWLAQDGTVVHQGDVVARLDPADATKQLRDATVDLDAADTALRAERLKTASELRARDNALQSATSDVTEQRRFLPTDPELYSRNAIAEAQIDLDIAAARQTQAELAARVGHATLATNIDLVALDRQRTSLAFDRARGSLSKMELRAPSDGVLVLRRDPTSGEPIQPGAELFAGREIADVPDTSAMEAELFVLEVDGDGLAVGQPVDITLASRPDHPYRATVKLVDKLAQPRVPGVPVQYFSVVASFDATDRAAMKPGQRVRADIAVSAADAIVIPRQAVVERDNRSLVFRRGDHGFAAVPVELGPASAGRVVVTSGLADGDVIALRDPDSASAAEVSR
jgi:multidrug resistance efflux pump|nr:HlyD family efflux transporter periplasmic adaptor subunit [Kofleriaceae bacterium]